jgi:hypothetical protein
MGPVVIETVPPDDAGLDDWEQEAETAAHAWQLIPRIRGLARHVRDLRRGNAELAETAAHYREDRNRLLALLSTPEIDEFDKAVPLEAGHQILRWGVEKDAGKTWADWFWLVGYLAGKALTAAITGDVDKAKHHCISTAAALRNWHAHLRAGSTVMRPVIDATAGEESTHAK